MALLSKIFRICPAIMTRVRPIKTYWGHRDFDFSDDSDDGISTYGDKPDPQAPLPPGMKMNYEPIPTEYFYNLAGVQKPRAPQPSYMAIVKDQQVWHIFNASTITLGRMASKIAQLVQAKHRPNYTHDHLLSDEQADFIVVVNGKYPLLLGTKGKMKIYRHHTTYPGHLHELNIRQVLSKACWKRVVEQAVGGMLPKNKLREKYMKRLHVYPEIYHDFDFLPQFVQRSAPDPNKILAVEDFKDPKLKIVWAQDPENIPEELKHLKYEPEDLETPFHKRNPRPVPYNNREKKISAKYFRTLRRFKVFEHRTQKFEIK
ncbi:hypothetical protein SteCoe_19643 [Stentor coeruleus]|uniref:Ribosomal protein L13 n=1 Tax=Stentor coeruleus TaxID=5963 RepID=A0A1R2BTV9_9CILI|nr:hypothetical protein SteCoe_19643 [Stentor coeruleus]